MSRMMRLYYYGILGAIGGNIAWQTSNLLGLSFTKNVYLSEVVVGALIGLSIGLVIGLGEGVATRNLIQMLRAALISAGLGLVGGAVGLPLAEGLFQLMGGNPWGRALGWGVFGLLVGVAAGFTSGNQMWKSALGGLVGGILGGALLEITRNWLQNPLLGKAVGLLLLGASVGACIALITFLLSNAWLEVKSGKLKGSEFILDKFISKESPSAFIGSDALKADIVLPDPDISPQHVLLKGTGVQFNIKDLSLNGTFVNNRRVEQTTLRNRQVIRLGNTELIYHERKAHTVKMGTVR